MNRRFITSDTLRQLMRAGTMRLELAKSDVVTDDARELAARSGFLFLQPSFRRPLVAGNWKMNLELGQAVALAAECAAKARARRERLPDVDLMIAPPHPYLAVCLAELRDSGVLLGAQDCAAAAPGAHTGEVAVEMLKSVGARYVVVGHSERRRMYGDTDQAVAAKVARVASAGLMPVLCVGETLDERTAGRAEAVVAAQLEAALRPLAPALHARVQVAYEPVWAIGTGKVAEAPDIDAMHRHAREVLRGLSGPAVASACRILYGGSVTARNSFTISKIPDVDGALVGGASLSAEDFLAVAEHFAKRQ